MQKIAPVGIFPLAVEVIIITLIITSFSRRRNLPVLGMDGALFLHAVPKWRQYRGDST